MPRKKFLALARGEAVLVVRGAPPTFVPGPRNCRGHCIERCLGDRAAKARFVVARSNASGLKSPTRAPTLYPSAKTQRMTAGRWSPQSPTPRNRMSLASPAAPPPRVDDQHRKPSAAAAQFQAQVAEQPSPHSEKGLWEILPAVPSRRPNQRKQDRDQHHQC